MTSDADRLELLEVYRRIALIRTFEEQAVRLFRRGELPGFLHPSVGQEAIAAAFTLPLTDHDMITSTHRGHGHVLAKGVSAATMFAELFGYETGACRGRGGSMHIMDIERGVLGANGVVGGGIPIAVGAALGSQLDESGRVVVAFFGEGAVNTGAFHEALNMAGIWRLPVILVCENNLYAESTPFADTIPTPDLMPRAASYGIPGRIIDGNDAVLCLKAAREAVSLARLGGGPSFIQANTYRWYGHHTGDPAPYRSDEEVQRWKNLDPLPRLGAVLVAMGVEEADLRSIADQTASEIQTALAESRQGEPPSPSHVLAYVLSGDGITP